MHDDAVEEIQQLLDEFARACVRAIVTRDMDVARIRRLAKFSFGCMNQKHELPRRIADRGPSEVLKVLQFLKEVEAALDEIAGLSE
jgi:hypothetical protein